MILKLGCEVLLHTWSHCPRIAIQLCRWSSLLCSPWLNVYNEGGIGQPLLPALFVHQSPVGRGGHLGYADCGMVFPGF